MFLFVCFVVVSTGSFAQITVLSNGYVGLRNSNPSYPIDIQGVTVIRPSSSSTPYAMFTTGTNGFNLYPSSSHTGMIGYQSVIYSVNADYVYATNIVYSSDERLKKNIQPINSAMLIIKKLRPVSFDYNFDYSMVEKENFRIKLQNDDKNRLGFIAQEVQKILPQSVKVKEADSTLCIRMDDFIPLLVKGMQEQSVKIDSLKSVIEEMKTSQSILKSATISTGSTTNLSEDLASLEQNIPNPFSKETKIGCTIPESSSSSVLYIYNMNGTQLQQHNVNGKGKQTVNISSNSLEPGMYFYALVVDGRDVDTKRMILTK